MQVISGDQGSLLSCATRLARSMASKSPLALVGTKRVLLHNRCAGCERRLRGVPTMFACTPAPLAAPG